MSIRRQSIISSGIVYAGFAIGLLNTYLFTREGGFTPSEYGLTGAFLAIANIMFSFASLGMPAFIYKFYPYYTDNLEPNENDMMTLALFTSLVGFALVMLSGFFFKNLVIRKFGGNSADLVKYYYWVFPFGFGLTLYSLLEAYAWQLKKSVLTNYLREIQWRFYTTVLIILTILGTIKRFDLFIKLYALGYLLLAGALLTYLVASGKFHLRFKLSRVTKKFSKKISSLAALVWSGSLIFNIANFFDIIVIAAVLPNGLALVGIFTLAQSVAAIIQAPQRAIISATMAPLSRAWKDKDFGKLKQIYIRSAINQLLFAAGMFALILMNFNDAVISFHLQRKFLEVGYVFFFLGLMRVIDMGTGLNAQIIATSVHWRFEFFSGLVLLAFSLPLNYILAKKMGVVGPAIATLAAMVIYNAIRYAFLFRKFGMQPFTAKTIFTILLAVAGFLICHLLLSQFNGFGWIVLRSLLFLAIYIPGILWLRLTPDLVPVLTTIKKRLGLGKPKA